MPTTSPLMTPDLTNINNALKQLNEFVTTHIANAKSAGLDTEPFERQAEYYNQAFNQLKTTYFPGK